MNEVTNWRRGTFDLSRYQLPGQFALRVERDRLPEVPMTAIIALSSSFMVDGKPVEAGATFRVPADIAAGLIATRKAKRA